MTRLRKYALYLLACSQTVTLLLMMSRMTEVVTYEGTHKDDVKELESFVARGLDAQDMGAKESNEDNHFTPRHVMEKVLLAGGVDDVDDETAVRRDAKLLVNMIKNERKVVKDSNEMDDGKAKFSKQITAQNRLERFGRVVLSAKYELEEMQRMKRLEPAVVALTRIIEQWKLNTNFSRNRIEIEHYTRFTHIGDDEYVWNTDIFNTYIA